MTFPELDEQLALMTRNFLGDSLRLGRVNRIMVDQFVASVELLCAENAKVIQEHWVTRDAGRVSGD